MTAIFVAWYSEKARGIAVLALIRGDKVCLRLRAHTHIRLWKPNKKSPAEFRLFKIKALRKFEVNDILKLILFLRENKTWYLMWIHMKYLAFLNLKSMESFFF